MFSSETKLTQDSNESVILDNLDMTSDHKVQFAYTITAMVNSVPRALDDSLQLPAQGSLKASTAITKHRPAREDKVVNVMVGIFSQGFGPIRHNLKGGLFDFYELSRAIEKK